MYDFYHNFTKRKYGHKPKLLLTDTDSHNIKRIQSKFQKLGTYKVSKISLPCFADEPYILDDWIGTLS